MLLHSLLKHSRTGTEGHTLTLRCPNSRQRVEDEDVCGGGGVGRSKWGENVHDK